ncbi:fumarylacetoacetate hydrolase family protein [Ilyonectria robusta]|uniref:fumarylacetoacetate hydrolase family protein n=1 Tax=Ilyonectria robusta TaxID=1079257 RepID=UPI001E8E90C4|nr:fumarylacetoacetate hydrolase family protein [Ilyonectria robusta]KAH8650769.1 fumarylacetoacetate hydrolase family protein [Ilyonectria robusta]
MATFGKLVRFKDRAGTAFYGEAEGLPSINKQGLIGSFVPVYASESPWDPNFRLTSETKRIAEVLPPLSHVPVFYCVGMNYKTHAREAGVNALAGPFDTIPIHPECQQMDYEVELTVVIGKDCKNVSEDENPFDYILGYTVGNDISSRWWQVPERSNGQPAAAKSFDKFAPLGPVITSKRLIPDPTQLRVSTRVNGDQRQYSETDDWIFDLGLLIRHLSRGTTLRKGSVIMTGTPSGVGYFMKPQTWLRHGDILETEIDGIGTMQNRIAFEANSA